MKLYAAVILSIFVIGSAPAFAQTVGISVTNGDNQDLYVAVSDQNQSGQVVFNQRLNQGASANVSVTADGSGNGSIGWRVVTTSTPPQAACGSQSGLTAGSEVTVVSFGSGASPC